MVRKMVLNDYPNIVKKRWSKGGHLLTYTLDSGTEADTDEMDGTYDPSGDDIPKDISQ